MKTVKNFIVRCWMTFILPFPLLYLFIVPVKGAEWNTFMLPKMRREMFNSLTAPRVQYALFALAQFSWFSGNIAFILYSQVVAICMFVFLYRISPNVWAWYMIQSRVQATLSATGDSNCVSEAGKNIKKLLMQLAEDLDWGCSDEPTPTTAVFVHAEWLASQLGFWKGERRSLFPERD